MLGRVSAGNPNPKWRLSNLDIWMEAQEVLLVREILEKEAEEAKENWR